MSAAVSDFRIPQWSLAERLRKARDVAGMDQKEFAAQTGISVASISRAERGLMLPKKPQLLAWSVATQVDFEWLETGAAKSVTPKESWLPAPAAAADIASRMQAAVGNVIASDEAIRRVLSLETVAEMKADERFLAWMLVTASDADPERVGLSDEDVPSFFDADQLRDALCLHGGSNPGPKD